MTPTEFCYWLQGFTELMPSQYGMPTKPQWDSICAHLALVFTKVTPDQAAPADHNRWIAGERGFDDQLPPGELPPLDMRRGSAQRLAAQRMIDDFNAKEAAHATITTPTTATVTMPLPDAVKQEQASLAKLVRDLKLAPGAGQSAVEQAVERILASWAEAEREIAGWKPRSDPDALIC